MNRRELLQRAPGAMIGTLAWTNPTTSRPDDMEFGAYFIRESQWDEAIAEGLTWCAWPPIVPDEKGNGDGFVTKKVLVDLRTRNETPYPRDEVPDPENLQEPAGSFITLSRAELGLNAHRLAPIYQRAIVNYFLGDRTGYWRDIEEGVLTAHRCAEAWRGTPWTAVINANTGGLLDRGSEHDLVPPDVLLDQLRWYRDLGARRVIFWRWDTPNGLLGIVRVMRRIRRGQL
jgi:hypothetical protein